MGSKIQQNKACNVRVEVYNKNEQQPGEKRNLNIKDLLIKQKDWLENQMNPKERVKNLK